MNKKEGRLASLGAPDFDGPPLVVAEISGNHGGSLDCMLEHIKAAANAGADAVKIQTYTADTMTLDHDGPGFVIKDPNSLWHGRTLYSLYAEAHTPWEWHSQIFELARKLEVGCFSSPFDITAVEFLEQFQPPAYKVASFELIDTQLLRAIASTGRAVIASTGMATPREIKVAVDSLRDAGCKQLTLLKCTSAYPAEAKDANLNALPLLREEFGVSVGLSDHTLGTTVGITAVALGIQMIEKHFVLDRSDGAVDAAFSLEPNELRDLVQQVHTAHSSLGAAVLGPGAADLASLQFRRSLYAVCTIAKGAPFTLQNVRSIRPGIGLSPEHFDALLQRRAQRAYSLGDPISEIEVSPSD